MQLLEKAKEELVNARQVRRIEEMQLKQSYDKMQSKIADMKMVVEDLANQMAATEIKREKVADTLYDHEELLEMFGVDIHTGKCSGKPNIFDFRFKSLILKCIDEISKFDCFVISEAKPIV